MSAEQFRQTVKNIPELKYWASGQNDTSSVLHQTRKSSEPEIQKTLVEHIIPFEQLSEILGSSAARAIFNEVKSGKYIGDFEGVSFVNKGGQESIIFNQVTFGNLNNYVAKYLETLLQNATNTSVSISGNVLNYIKVNKLERGHVFGWGNTLVYRTKESAGATIRAQVGKSEQEIHDELDVLDTFINNLLNTLESYDQASSAVKGLESEVYAKYRKTGSHWLTTWEAKAHNLATGNIVGAALGRQDNKGTGVRGFLKHAAYGATSLAEKALTAMVEGFVKVGLTSDEKSLINVKTSPAMVELIEDEIYSALTGKPKKLKSEYVESVKLDNLVLRKITNNRKTSSRDVANKLKSVQQKIRTAKSRSSSSKPTNEISLSSLQVLLNRHLQDVISANMGDGNSRNVLNYRTGRLAASAKVERLTQSRDGMISAFYSYMRNPYGTFSEGGKQQYPRSRDPKLLISKSIKEIALEVAITRMRAVLV